jgi:hypothetical protein
MNRRVLPVLLLAATAAAQGPDMLVSYSQQEQTLSLSGGTVLQRLLPNEIAYLEWSNGPCAAPSAEKWAPRTAFDTMAGDENGDGTLFAPFLFGRIDALCVGFGLSPAVGTTNLRQVFWSPEVGMGPVVAGAPSLRPGDVGRIVRQGLLDGQVEYFMRQEQFNQALGLPLNTPIDIDAITFQPGFGVYFSLDQDIGANTFCGPTFVRDGDLLVVPDWAITWTPDFRVAAVLPNSAAVVYNEAQIQAMVVNANVANHLGNCVNTVPRHGRAGAALRVLGRDHDRCRPADDGRRRPDLQPHLWPGGDAVRRHHDGQPVGHPPGDDGRGSAELRQRAGVRPRLHARARAAAARDERAVRRAGGCQPRRLQLAVRGELRVRRTGRHAGAAVAAGLPVLAAVLPGHLHHQPDPLRPGVRPVRQFPGDGDPAGAAADQAAVPERRYRW